MAKTYELDRAVSGELGRRGLRGGLLLASGSWVRFVLQLGSNIALARILGPSEYGLAAVLIVIGAASELLRDSGAATVVTQDRSMTHQQASGLFWLSVAIGSAAAVVVALSGVPLAAVFHEPRLIVFAPLMSVMFIATGIAAVPGAVSARNLRFVPGALSDISGAVLGTVVGVIVALSGGGALALVLQSVTFVVVQSAVVWVLCAWAPSAPRRGDLSRLHTQEAGHLTTVQVLNYMVTNIDNLLIGIVAGVRQAGLYNQAYRLLVLPLQQVLGPVQRVVLPAMSLLRNDRRAYIDLFSNVLLGSTLLLWTLFAIAAAEAPLFVVLVFGHGWIESAPVFQILAISGLAQAVGYTTTWLFIASRQPRRFARWMIVSRIAIVLILIAGLPWGPIGVASAYSAACVALVLPEFFLAAIGSGIRFVHALRAVAWPALAALGAVLVAALIHRSTGSGTSWLDLLLHVAAELLPFALIVLLVPRVRAVVVGAVRTALRRRTPTPTQGDIDATGTAHRILPTSSSERAAPR